MFSAFALLLILKVHLIPAFISGFVVFELVNSLAPLLRIPRLSGNRARVLVVALISIMVVALLILLIWWIRSFFHVDSNGISALFKKMAEIIEGSHSMLPDWSDRYLPQDAEELKFATATWLNQHAGALPMAGMETARVTAQILIGMVLGSIVSLRKASSPEYLAPLTYALQERIRLFHLSFREIVFAQSRISALNTLFTWLYLMVVLPLFGIELPFAKTMVAITFITGLLPVIGNLISNTIIVIVSLSMSLGVALASLVFLVIIHKLEYFLNARIIGSQIRASAWELLVAMLVMEATFGLAGVFMAPIYYAYLKKELAERGLI
ncbi:MAG: AI-2E family transporter [Syntrophaceae bacterium]